MRRISDWCRRHPWWSFALALFVSFVAANLLLHWKTERRWKQYCADARARGLKLSAIELARPPIPDAENFAEIPLLKAAFAGGGARPLALPPTRGDRPLFGNILKGERIDWAAWQDDFLRAGYIHEKTAEPARDVLRGLEHYAPLFAQWGEWRSRPHCRFDLDLKLGSATPLPHLGTFQDAAKVFALRLRAHLAVGDSGAAYDDFLECLHGYLALLEEPTTIDGLVRISMLAILFGAVGEGLHDHAWEDRDLMRIQQELRALRPWQDYRHTLLGEHAFLNTISDQFLQASSVSRATTVSNLGGGGRGMALWMTFLPDRAFRDNQLRQNQFFDELIARVDATGTIYDPDADLPSSTRSLGGIVAPLYYFPQKVLATPFEGVVRNFELIAIRRDECLIACALERYRIRHGDFPETLEALVPEFITEMPMDTYTRAPFIYQRVAPGSFRLYSVGPNRRDDRGTLDPALNEKKQVDDVWFYAPPHPMP